MKRAAHRASIRKARPEDAPLLAAAERMIATVPGKLASTPNEIDDVYMALWVGR